MKNSICKLCGNYYHHCGSCDAPDWAYDYCSDKCWSLVKGEAQKEMKQLLIEAKLTKDQLEKLSGWLHPDEIIYALDDVLEELIREKEEEGG